MTYTMAEFEQASQRLSQFILNTAARIAAVYGVSYVAVPSDSAEPAPETYAGIRRMFSDATVIGLVPVRVSADGCDKTIYSEPSVNWAFRFWHDYLHWSQKLDLFLQDELRVASFHLSAVSRKFGEGSLEVKLMAIDTVAQALYFNINGEHVEDQRQFALDHLGIVS